MKILLLAPQPFYMERGTPIAVLNLARVLGEAGHEIDLLTFAGGTDVKLQNTQISCVGFGFSRYDFPVGFSVRKLFFDFLMGNAALWKCLRGRYDVIHAVEESVYIGMLCAPIKGSRLVYDMDSSMSDQLVEKWPRLASMQGVLDWWEGLAVKRSSRVIAVCKALADKAEGYGTKTPVDVLEDVVMETPEDATPAEDLRQHLPEISKLMLYIGNLEHYQGVGLVIEALARPEAGKEAVFVVIGGTDEDIEHHRQLAEKLGISERVVFLGPRPVSSLMSYLRQADMLVSPRAKGVNTPMKIYSYLGSGVPLLATDIPSHTQVLNATNACLAAPTPEAMATGIRRLAQDANYARALGDQALRDANERFSFEAFRTRLLGIYEKLDQR